jgi:hypothetical protein
MTARAFVAAILLALVTALHGHRVDALMQAAASPSAPAPYLGLDAVIASAEAYVASWQAALSSVVIEEELTQRASGGRWPEVRRVTRADLLLLRQPAGGSWLTFRDVFELDGRPVRDHDDRLRQLFLASPSSALESAERIASESSRYNVGPVIRTIDVPMFGLTLLRPDLRARFTFKKRREEPLDGVLTWRVDYVEPMRPTIVRTLRGESVPLEGSFWVEPASGRIMRTLVKVQGTPDPGVRMPPSSGSTLMWVQVTFAPNDTLGMWVPARMNELAMAADRSMVVVAAMYSNVRRFEVNTTETFHSP